MNTSSPAQLTVVVPDVKLDETVEYQLGHRVTDRLSALRNTTYILQAHSDGPGSDICVSEVRPKEGVAGYRLFFDLTVGSESLRLPYWFASPADDANLGRKMIEREHRAVHRLITSLERLDEIAYFFAWHIEGEPFSNCQFRGHDKDHWLSETWDWMCSASPCAF